MNRLALFALLPLLLTTQARRQAHHGPGTKNRMRGYGRYAGTTLRAILPRVGRTSDNEHDEEFDACLCWDYVDPQLLGNWGT